MGDANVIFGSVCSGIEAASVAWHHLGWKAAWLAEIEPFPAAVLAHHYPEVPNLGDMTAIADRVRSGDIGAPDVLVGGTPCQAFSVAGLRGGLSDPRGALTIAYVDLANAIDAARHVRGDDPCVVVWENVPGVLSSKDNAFGCFLGALAGESCELQPAGGRWANAGLVLGPERAVAWRVLDAQYFGVAQRRRRVFVVASAREGFDPAAVLFEWDGVRRDSAPSREQGKAAPTIPARSTAGGGLGTDFDCDGGLIAQAVSLRGREGGATAELGDDIQNCLRASGGGGDKPHVLLHADPIARYVTTGEAKRQDWETCNFVAHTLKAEGFDANEDGTGRGTPLVPVAFSCKDYGGDAGPVSPTLRSMWHDGSHANAGGQVASVCFDTTQITSAANYSNPKAGDPCHPLAAGAHPPAIATTMQVRRLTPRECERLQGFPDDYTMIPWRKKPASECPDGPRYKALGNSMAVPVMRWIGRRIDAVLSGVAS